MLLISQISKKSLSRWIKNSPQILQNAFSNSLRLPGGGRKPFNLELEDYLLRYI